MLGAERLHWVRRNDTSWVKLHNASTQGIAAGGFD
jgi:hypothetical protein